MKITKGDIIITDVPGIVSITVKRDPGTDAGVRIDIKDGGGMQEWTLPELTQYRDALSAAIDAAQELSGQQSTPSTGPQVFRRGDDIPDDVVKVRDCEGDIWVWNGMRWTAPAMYPYTTHDLLSLWAPVTEVRD